jgi:hypothetical protein
MGPGPGPGPGSSLADFLRHLETAADPTESVEDARTSLAPAPSEVPDSKNKSDWCGNGRAGPEGLRYTEWSVAELWPYPEMNHWIYRLRCACRRAGLQEPEACHLARWVAAENRFSLMALWMFQRRYLQCKLGPQDFEAWAFVTPGSKTYKKVQAKLQRMIDTGTGALRLRSPDDGPAAPAPADQVIKEARDIEDTQPSDPTGQPQPGPPEHAATAPKEKGAKTPSPEPTTESPARAHCPTRPRPSPTREASRILNNSKPVIGAGKFVGSSKDGAPSPPKPPTARRRRPANAATGATKETGAKTPSPEPTTESPARAHCPTRPRSSPTREASRILNHSKPVTDAGKFVGSSKDGAPSPQPTPVTVRRKRPANAYWCPARRCWRAATPPTPVKLFDGYEEAAAPTPPKKEGLQPEPPKPPDIEVAGPTPPKIEGLVSEPPKPPDIPPPRQRRRGDARPSHQLSGADAPLASSPSSSPPPRNPSCARAPLSRSRPTRSRRTPRTRSRVQDYTKPGILGDAPNTPHHLPLPFPFPLPSLNQARPDESTAPPLPPPYAPPHALLYAPPCAPVVIPFGSFWSGLFWFVVPAALGLVPHRPLWRGLLVPFPGLL